MTGPLPAPHFSVARHLTRLLMTLLFTRCALRGREHLPEPGTPFILALNQDGPLDTLIVLAGMPIPLHVLLPEETLRIPMIGWAAARAGAIGVRSAHFDLRAIRTAIRCLLEARRPVVLFVRGPSEQGPPAQRFACGLMASRTNVPVIPGYVQGSQGLWPAGAWVPRYNRDVSLTLGAPLTLGLEPHSPRADLVRATDQIVAAIHALAPAGTPAGPEPQRLTHPESR